MKESLHFSKILKEKEGKKALLNDFLREKLKSKDSHLAVMNVTALNSQNIDLAHFQALASPEMILSDLKSVIEAQMYLKFPHLNDMKIKRILIDEKFAIANINFISFAQVFKTNQKIDLKIHLSKAIENKTEIASPKTSPENVSEDERNEILKEMTKTLSEKGFSSLPPYKDCLKLFGSNLIRKFGGFQSIKKANIKFIGNKLSTSENTTNGPKTSNKNNLKQKTIEILSKIDKKTEEKQKVVDESNKKKVIEKKKSNEKKKVEKNAPENNVNEKKSNEKKKVEKNALENNVNVKKDKDNTQRKKKPKKTKGKHSKNNPKETQKKKRKTKTDLNEIPIDQFSLKAKVGGKSDEIFASKFDLKEKKRKKSKTDQTPIIESSSLSDSSSETQ